MAVMALQKIGKAGLDVSASAPAVTSSDKFQNAARGRTLIYVNNGGASPDSVEVDGNPDVIVSVPAGQHRVIGPFDDKFEDSSGFCLVSHSFTATVGAMAAFLAEE